MHIKGNYGLLTLLGGINYTDVILATVTTSVSGSRLIMGFVIVFLGPEVIFLFRK